MKIKSSISIVFIFFMTIPMTVAGEKRLLIVSGQKEEKTFEETLKKLDRNKAFLIERDVEVIVKQEKKFSIRLIGKDGTEKWLKIESFEIQEINQLIDQMPMRRQEMLKK